MRLRYDDDMVVLRLRYDDSTLRLCYDQLVGAAVADVFVVAIPLLVYDCVTTKL